MLCVQFVLMTSLFPCTDQKNPTGERGADMVFETSTLFADGRTDLSREAIRPIASRLKSLPVF